MIDWLTALTIFAYGAAFAANLLATAIEEEFKMKVVYGSLTVSFACLAYGVVVSP